MTVINKGFQELNNFQGHNTALPWNIQMMADF